MVINTTRWSPDTCECVLEYDWDSTVTEDNRVHTLSNYVSVCPAHQGLADHQARWNTILEENPRKNNAHQYVLDNSPTTALYDVIDGSRHLKKNITFNFTWSGTAPNRVLTISYTGISLTSNQKNTIQTFLDSRFSGKVLIS